MLEIECLDLDAQRVLGRRGKRLGLANESEWTAVHNHSQPRLYKYRGFDWQIGYKGNADSNLVNRMMLIKGLVVEMALPAIESDIRYGEAKTGEAKLKQIVDIEGVRLVAYNVQVGNLDRKLLDDRREPVQRTPRCLDPNLAHGSKICRTLAFAHVQAVGAESQRVWIEPDGANGHPPMESRGHKSPGEMIEQQRDS